ncbi:FAD-binding protein [Pseudomonas aeruginosa]|nr:FAD-binding protein [Pseudomonas aeruginosa]
MDDSELYRSLCEILGARGVRDSAALAGQDPGYHPQNLAGSFLVLPESTDQVAAVVRLCRQAGRALVPQGGLTGLVGGGAAQAGDVLLSLRRLNRIHRLDAASQTLDLDAGVTLEQAQALAAEAGLDPGIDLAARGSASIGGLVATNAGGIRAFRFGTMRQRVLGLEAVLADGSVYSDLRGLLKNTTGYDLKQLFVGAEGTLGIVTRAVLRLEPLQRPGATALLGLPDVDAAIAIAARLRREHAERLFACEILWHDYLQCTAAPHGRQRAEPGALPSLPAGGAGRGPPPGCRRGAHRPAGRLLRGRAGGRRPARRQRNPAPGHLAPARRLRRGHPRRRRQPVLRRIAAGAGPGRLRQAHPAAPGRPGEGHAGLPLRPFPRRQPARHARRRRPAAAAAPGGGGNPLRRVGRMRWRDLRRARHRPGEEGSPGTLRRSAEARADGADQGTARPQRTVQPRQGHTLNAYPSGIAFPPTETAMRIVSRDRWFETRHFYNGISLIHEPYVRPFYRCNMWHVQGRERDVLVDSGSGLVSLREQLPWLTERPLLAVASHTHFDHIAGHHEFAERLAHPAEAEILAAPDGDNTLARAYVGDEMFEAHPECPLCYAEYRVRAAPATRLIDEGDVLDLGDRVLQVLHTPGHSPGGISLWEAATQTLFSGDIVYDGPLVEDAYHSNLDDYASSLARLRELPVRTVHGGHFASFSGERLREMIVAWFRNHDR